MIDTIAAIATPLGIGGIGVIRISGADALGVTGQLLKKPLLPPVVPRMAISVTVCAPNGDELDSGLLLYFKGPHSYTGEDVVELQLHGNSQILMRVLAALYAQGVRAALPGEFTRRAFVNGKLDLAEAESVADLIHSEGVGAQSSALMQLKGRLSAEIVAARSPLVRILEHIEASIDFPDEVDGIDRVEALAEIETIADRLTHMIQIQNFGRLVRDGVRCVIVGRPNVGKSSLLNRLSGEDRAIVSEIAGTTRDYIETSIRYRELVLHIVDTAGIRSAGDEIEQQGIDKIDHLIAMADVALWVIDQSVPLSHDDDALIQKVSRVPIQIGVANKTDLPSVANRADVISVSAKSGSGIEALKERIYDRVSENQDRSHLEFICNSRQLACIIQAESALRHVISGMREGFEDDVLAIDLKTAILKLGEITGDAVTEEVLDGIFARFCVGK